MATTTAPQVLGYWRLERNAMVRGQRTADGHTETVHCAGLGDASRVALGADYTSDCSYCYLGAGHTMDLHERQVTR